MKKFMGLFVSLILIVGILSGCSGANDKDAQSKSDNSSKEQTKDAGNSQWPRTIKDATGKEIKF
ncbi:ferrichrome ABC transporter, partial [Clostridium botulinum]|nr:ferrichrome ABC transporter [Clostridium botulinum]MBO0537759.1 ferrichrome ABC transporter [Clostridium botulinum]MBO0550773.1 ferrichrome ABC transporter [Clostridium botulinum]